MENSIAFIAYVLICVVCLVMIVLTARKGWSRNVTVYITVVMFCLIRMRQIWVQRH